MVRLLDSYIWCFFKSIIQHLRFMSEIHLFITPNCHAPRRRWSKCLNLPPQYLTALKKDIHLFQVKLTCDPCDVLSYSGSEGMLLYNCMTFANIVVMHQLLEKWLLDFNMTCVLYKQTCLWADSAVSDKIPTIDCRVVPFAETEEAPMTPSLTPDNPQ